MNQCVSERPPKKQKKNLGMVVGLRAWFWFILKPYKR
jgi:hypothetical protein